MGFSGGSTGRAEAADLGLRKGRAENLFSVVVALEGQRPLGEQSLRPAVGGA